jgi:hypothetical protein
VAVVVERMVQLEPEQLVQAELVVVAMVLLLVKVTVVTV